MENWQFNLMLSRVKFEHGCGRKKSTGTLSPGENTSTSKAGVLNDRDKNIHSLDDSYNSSYSNPNSLFDSRNLIYNDTSLILVKHRNSNHYYTYLDIKKCILEIDNEHLFLSELKSYFYTFQNYSSMNNGSKSKGSYYGRYTYDIKTSWKNHIKNFIDRYLYYQIRIENFILSNSNNYSNSSIYRSKFTCDESRKNRKSESFPLRTSTNSNDLTAKKSYNTPNEIQKYKHLWVQCENCYRLNYKRFFKSKMNICEQCGYHLKMSSSDRIELLIDPGTWEPMDTDMVSLDPIEFNSEDKPYKKRIDFYQRKTGLPEAVQTGIGQLNGISIAIGIMEFQFMGGSMGSVVGEKITRLVEYASNQFLPLIIVCASGGARMQEGSLSLMQMAKISSALYNYQSTKKLFYISILTSPTTGGVTASFGMLGDIIIAEPNAYIAFAGKRVIEQTLNKTVPEGSQVAEYLFQKGLFDLIVPRNLLKDVLSELVKLHAFFPLNYN
nr:acetyl co-A carboxylase [Quinchamalium chilense]